MKNGGVSYSDLYVYKGVTTFVLYPKEITCH